MMQVDAAGTTGRHTVRLHLVANGKHHGGRAWSHTAVRGGRSCSQTADMVIPTTTPGSADEHDMGHGLRRCMRCRPVDSGAYLAHLASTTEKNRSNHTRQRRENKSTI